MSDGRTIELQEYKSQIKPAWCPGCGDFAVLNGLQRALQVLQIEPWNIVIVSGIGCSSNIPHFLSTYGFHSIHGRAVPVASGIKLANPDLTVIAAGGDGDGFGIGVGHFIHAMRRNLDITYIVMDNQIYGLTTGQASPTSEKGMVTKSTPEGVIENPVNPLTLALASGATYIARGFSGDAKGLGDLFARGIKHKGFSLIDVLSPCVTYNKINTYDWFRQRVYPLEKEGHNPSDYLAAVARANEWPNLDQKRDRIGLGVFYERNDIPTYEDLEPALRKGPLVRQPLGIENTEELLEEFR
jgi:2-oxoglutarate ferredoxin oxidoreductase subunit beta